MESESNVRLPAVEVERVHGMARVTLRRNFEEFARDDEGAMWRWDEVSVETPVVDGLEDVVAADFDAWWSYAERIAEMEARVEADERAVEAAVAALPVYQEENDMAMLELGDLTAGAESRISAVEVALMEIGDMIGGGA